MGGKASRNKGAAAERELFNLLNAHLGTVEFRRNILQSAIGGQDSMSARNPFEMLPVALEVKRCETLAFPKWIAQAKEQAKPGQLPALAWRRSQEPWTIAVMMTPEQFADYYKTLRVTEALGIEQANFLAALKAGHREA